MTEVQRLQAQSGASVADAFGSAVWNDCAMPLREKNCYMSYMALWRALGTSTVWPLSLVAMSTWTSRRRCPLKWSGKQHRIPLTAAGYQPTDAGAREDLRSPRWRWIPWIVHKLKNQVVQPGREVLDNGLCHPHRSTNMTPSRWENPGGRILWSNRHAVSPRACS